VPSFLRKDLIASSDGRSLCLGTHEKWDCLIGFGLSRKADLLAEIDKEEAIAVTRGEPYDRDAAGARKFSSLQELSFDASGRFVLPPMLQSMGNLDGNVIFHGIGNVFCLWNPQSLLDTPADVPVDKRMVEFHLKEAGKKK
jgi:MraZ protein